MPETIDYQTTGVESAITKSKALTSSINGLDAAWNKYSTSMSASGKLGGGVFSKLSSGGATGLGGAVQSAVAFASVSKIMDKLLSGKVRDFFAKAVAEDVRRYKNIGSSIASALRPVSSFVAKTARATTLDAGLRAGVFFDKYLKNIKMPKLSLPKLPNFLRLGLIESRIVATITKRTLGQLLGKTPLSILIGIPLLLAMLDTRVSDWIGKKASQFSNWVSKKVEVAYKFYSSAFGSFRRGLARLTNNPYYAGRQFDVAEAMKQNTPAQQRKFIEEEVKKLKDSDAEELIRKTRKELTDLFNAENLKRNQEILALRDAMVYQGRL